MNKIFRKASACGQPSKKNIIGKIYRETKNTMLSIVNGKDTAVYIVSYL